jgi:hypothetical protein
MSKQDKEKQYLSLKSMFETNNVKKMRDIEKIYPTMVALDMGTNHGRYIKKLHNPENFTIKQIFKLASLINIHPTIIINIVVAEVSAKNKTRK